MKSKAIAVQILSIAFILSFLLTGSYLTGSECHGREKPKDVVIRYGGSSWVGHYPVWIGIQKNIFKKNGLTVDFKSFQISSARMGALISNDIDFASTGSISAIALMAAGVKSFYAIGTQDDYATVEGIIVRGSHIRSVKDLRGKKLAVTFASSAHVLVLDVLEQNGLEPQKDVLLINLKTSEMPAAFQAREIDACALWTPIFHKVLALADARLLLNVTDFSLYDEYGIGPGPDLLVARKGFVKKHPEIYNTFIKSYFESVETLSKHPEACVPLLREFTGLEITEQQRVLKDISWYGLNKQKMLMSLNGPFVAGLQKLADFLENKALIDHCPTVKNWVDTRLYR